MFCTNLRSGATLKVAWTFCAEYGYVICKEDGGFDLTTRHLAMLIVAECTLQETAAQQHPLVHTQQASLLGLS